MSAPLSQYYGTLGYAVELKCKLKDGEDNWNDEYSNYKKMLEPYELFIERNDSHNVRTISLYLTTTGMVRAYVACDNCMLGENVCKCEDNKLVYYPEEVLDEIYRTHYKAPLELGYKDYANSTLNYLRKCYSYTVGGYTTVTDENGNIKQVKDDSRVNDSIKMYSYRTTEKTEETFKYDKEGNARKLTPTYAYPIKEQYIQYSNLVSEYAVPVEFMINLLEITGSKDFINAFMETVGDENYVEIKLFTINNITIEESTETATRDITVTGHRDVEFKYGIYKWQKKDEIFDFWDVNGPKDNAKITIKIDYENSKVKGYLDKDTATEGIRYTVYLREISKDRDNGYFDHPDRQFGDNCDPSVYWDDIDDVFENEWVIGNPDNPLGSPVLSRKWTDTSDITITKTSTIESTKYDVGVTEVKTWYGTRKPISKIDIGYTIQNLQETEDGFNWNTIGEYTTLESHEKINAEELVSMLINAAINTEAVPQSNRSKEIEFEDGVNNDIFKKQKITYTEDMEYTENDCWNVQVNYAINKWGENKETAAFNGWYEPVKISYTDSNIEKTSKRIVLQSVLYSELDQTQPDAQGFSKFLGLLSNAYGKYSLGADFVPETSRGKIKESGGKLVEYNDLYDSTTKVANLLINGEDMLYQLLASSENTEGLVTYMKIALDIYSKGDYSVTEWNEFVNRVINKDDWIPIEQK